MALAEQHCAVLHLQKRAISCPTLMTIAGVRSHREHRRVRHSLRCVDADRTAVLIATLTVGEAWPAACELVTTVNVAEYHAAYGSRAPLAAAPSRLRLAVVELDTIRTGRRCNHSTADTIRVLLVELAPRRRSTSVQPRFEQEYQSWHSAWCNPMLSSRLDVWYT